MGVDDVTAGINDQLWCLDEEIKIASFPFFSSISVVLTPTERQRRNNWESLLKYRSEAYFVYYFLASFDKAAGWCNPSFLESKWRRSSCLFRFPWGTVFTIRSNTEKSSSQSAAQKEKTVEWCLIWHIFLFFSWFPCDPLGGHLVLTFRLEARGR